MAKIIRFPNSNGEKVKSNHDRWFDMAFSDLKSLSHSQLIEASKVISLLAAGYVITWDNERMLFNRDGAI